MATGAYASYNGQSVYNQPGMAPAYVPQQQMSSQPGGGYASLGGQTVYNVPGSAPQVVTAQNVPTIPTAPSSQSQSPAPSNNQSSSGRNITEQDALRMGLDWNNLPSGYSRNVPQGPSQEQITAEINSMYEPQMGYLNQAEAQLRGDFPTIQAELQKQSEANAAQLAANKNKAIGGVEKNLATGKAKKEDALAQARRLFSELQRGAQARFGGASSAGQAVSEIQGQEMQRQQGGTQRDFATFMQGIEQQRSQIESDFNAQSLQLETQKQSALNQAQRDFQSKLLQISQLKAEAESNKAARRLQALQDLRAQVFNINQQNTQFQQQLEMMKYQQQLSLQEYQAKLAGQTSPTYNTTQAQYSTPSQTATGTQTSPLQYAGLISTNKKQEDLFSPTYQGSGAW